MPDQNPNLAIHMRSPSVSTPLLSHPSRSASPESVPSSETRTLILACSLTFFFFLVELIGGYLASSIAIMSDAAHLLSDLTGFVISLIAVSVSRLPATPKLSYGYARAQVLGAFVSIMLIWSLTVMLVFAAVERLFKPAPVNGPIMLCLGITGLAVNIVLGLALGHEHAHGHGHSHGHEHSPGYGHAHGHFDSHAHDHSHLPSHVHRRDHSHEHDASNSGATYSHHSHEEHDHHGENEEHASGVLGMISSMWSDFMDKTFRAHSSSSLAIQAAYLHVLGDAVQNLGVILAAILITFHPSWTFLDPICTLIFSVIVFLTTKNLAEETLHTLMEGTPSGLDLEKVYRVLRRIEGVRRVADLHVWSISPDVPALSAHLVKDSAASSQDIVRASEQKLKERFGITHATIQINCDPSEGGNSDSQVLSDNGQNRLAPNHLPLSLSADQEPPV